VIAARAMLRMSADGLQDLMMRTENARIELETARAAVPYKYMVTRPADRPRTPDSPNVAVLLLGGLVAGLGAGLMLALRRYIVTETERSGLGLFALVQAQAALTRASAPAPVAPAAA
jgi:LPS O-antigen subunit length determinant protein (WzzB/FepE family)